MQVILVRLYTLSNSTGNELLSGSDSGLAETLYHHMVGGPRPPEVGGRTKFRSPSYQIQEGESINIDVTSPGATLALGLMFLQTGELFRIFSESTRFWFPNYADLLQLVP